MCDIAGVSEESLCSVEVAERNGDLASDRYSRRQVRPLAARGLSAETVFGEDPLAMAPEWVAEGGERLHLVDLDGARDGHVANREVIRNLVNTVSVPCELGGGIRTERAVADWLELGLQQVVIGTRAIEDEAWFRGIVDKFPHQVVLGINTQMAGWPPTVG